MDSSLAPAAYAGTLLLALRLLVEANFFEMMSDLFEVYPLWGVVLSISFLFTSAKLLASSFAFARVCLPVVAAGTSRFLACLSAAATRRASLVREAVVSASRGFVTTLGSTTAAGILSWVLCRLLLPPLLSIARPFARAILGQYAAWESRVLARLGDFADLVCVDMGRRVERRRVLRTRELQWSAQRSRLDQLNDLVALIARNAADAWSESREWLGGRYEHLRPSEFAGRVAITAPEQGPLPPLGLWFRLRHRIDLDVYWADQTIARLDAAMERNQVAIADLERQVAVRSREIRAINDQVRDCRQRARAALVSTSFEPESPLERKVKADDEPIATEEPEPKISSFSSSTEEEEEDDEAMVDVAFINVPTKSEAEPSHEEEEATMEVEPLLALPIPGPETELGEVMELELTTLAAEEPKTVVHIVPAQESEKAEVFTDLTDTPMPEASFQEEKEEGEEGEKDEAMTVEQHQPAAQAEPFDDQMHIDLPQPWEQQMVTYQMAEEARLDAIDEQYRRADDAEVRAAWQAELEAAEAQRLADEQAERELALALQAAIEEHDRQQAETAERARQEQQAMMEQVALDQARQQQQEAENAAWMQELARIAQMAEAALQKSTQLAERRQREQEQQEEEQALLIAQAAATPAQPAVTAEEAVVATGAGVDSGLEAQAGQPNQEASNSTEEDTDLNEQELSFLMCEGSGFDDFLFGDFSALEEEVNTATQGAEATGTTAATTTTTTTTTTNTAPSFVLTLPSTTPGPAADANHTPVSTTNQADPTPTPEPADQLTIPGLAPPVSEFNFSMDTREAKAKAKAKASDSKPAPAEEAETQQQQQQQPAGASANPGARKILPAKGRLAKLRAAGDPRAELADQQQQHQHQQSSANNDASIEEELAALEQGWAEEERQDPEWARAEAEHLARQEEEGKRAKAEARALARAQAALELRQQEEQRREHAARFATAAASSFGQETIFRPPEPGEEARFDPRAQEARAEAETAIAMRTADEEARRRAASHKIDRDPEPEPEDVVDWGDEEISEEE
ncbi:hypothetical protein L209DRAFT_814621 [Thermothelomyces heterothallicus CBS 203.75]